SVHLAGTPPGVHSELSRPTRTPAFLSSGRGRRAQASHGLRSRVRAINSRRGTSNGADRRRTMTMISRTPPRPRKQLFQTIFALAIVLALPCTPARAQPAKIDVLRIGSTGSLTGDADSSREKAGTETLRSFIRDETGLKNEVLPRKNWQDL